MSPFITESEAQEFLERRERDKSACRYCGDSIFYTTLHARRVPMDWEPVGNGNYDLGINQFHGERVIIATENSGDKGTHKRHVCPEREVRLGGPVTPWLENSEEIADHYSD